MNAAIERFAIDNAKAGIHRTLPDDEYALGANEGHRAAFAVFALGKQAIPGWQHPVIERVAPEDDRLKGWLVGYMYALQCLATNEGAWI